MIIGAYSVVPTSVSWLGEPTGNTRVVRDTFETIDQESVTLKTVHKKRFSFSLILIPTATRDAINTLFNSDFFAFSPEPYDTTTYYCKVLDVGQWLPRPETTAFYDLESVTLEVIDLESSFIDLTILRDSSFLYKNLGIGELNGAETILTVYFNSSTGATYSAGGRGTSSLPFSELADLQDKMTEFNIKYMKYEISFSGIDQISGYKRNYIYADGFSKMPLIQDFTSLITGTITAMCVYNRNEDDVFSPDDVRKDWWKKSDTSWFAEVGEFPERVLIVCADSLYIIDLDTQSVWMEFTPVSHNTMISGGLVSAYPLKAVFMKNGFLFVAWNNGSAGAFNVVSFLNDNAEYYQASIGYKILTTISNRNEDWFTNGKFINLGINPVISAVVNSVHANVINGTLYAIVGTDGGLSQINMDTGVVWDMYSNTTPFPINNNYIDKQGKIYFSCQNQSGNSEYFDFFTVPLLTADDTFSGGYDNSLRDTRFLGFSGTSINLPTDNSDATINSNSSIFDIDIKENSSLSESGQNKIILAKETKLTILHENSTPANGWYQYITKDYNTGLLYGDTSAVGCYLNGTDSVIADRTYRANTLTNNGTVVILADATAPFGVSASFNGIDQSLTAEVDILDSGTAIVFSCWLELSTDGQIYILSKTDGTTPFGLEINRTASNIGFYIADGISAYVGKFNIGGYVFPTGINHVVCIGDISTQVIKIFVNGVEISTATTIGTWVGLSVLDSINDFVLMKHPALAYVNGKLSQVKILNALPNDIDSWVKAEYELGRNTIGKTATLQGNSNRVNSVSVLGDKILLSTGDAIATGKVQSFDGNGSILISDYADTVASDNLVVSDSQDAYFSRNTNAVADKLTGYIVGKDVFSEIYKLYANSGNVTGSATFSSGGASQSVTDSRARTTSKVFVMPTEEQDGFWSVVVANGSFTVNSSASEGADVDFDYLIINE